MKNLIYRLNGIWLRSIVFLLIVINTNQLIAQDTIPINLEKVLELGGADNLTIKEYKERQELSLAELSKAKEWWLPEIYAGTQTHQLWGAAMNADGRFFLDVSRQNLWAGLGLNASWDFAQGIYNIKSAGFMSSASQYLTAAERNQQILKMIRAYYELVTTQLNYNAYQNLVFQSDSVVQQIQLQVEVGLLFESEWLLAKSNKNHLQVEMFNAKKDYNRASAGLKRLLNIEQNIQFKVADEPLLPLDFTAEVALVDEEWDKEKYSTYLNRPEIKANALQLKALEIERRKYTTGLLIPELNIGTYGSYFGRISGKIAPVFPDRFPQTNQLDPTAALDVSLLWKIPLGDWVSGGNKKVAQNRINLKSLEAQQLRVHINEEIINAQSDLQLGKEEIEVAKEGLDFTIKALSQSIERQKLGTAKPFEVFQAQQFYLQAQLDYLRATARYNAAQFALKVAKGEKL